MTTWRIRSPKIIEVSIFFSPTEISRKFWIDTMHHMLLSKKAAAPRPKKHAAGE
jgi:hypothetical protein